MKKFLIISLMFLLSELLAMESINNERINSIDLNKVLDPVDPKEINWKMYKKVFFDVYKQTEMGTEKIWRSFKAGVKEGSIQVTPIKGVLPQFGNENYYFAYSAKEIEYNGKKARFMYPSPRFLYSPLNVSFILFTIDNRGTSSLFVNAQWGTNNGNDNEKNLPVELHPLQKYWPNWQDSKKFWLYRSHPSNKD